MRATGTGEKPDHHDLAHRVASALAMAEAAGTQDHELFRWVAGAFCIQPGGDRPTAGCQDALLAAPEGEAAGEGVNEAAVGHLPRGLPGSIGRQDRASIRFVNSANSSKALSHNQLPSAAPSSWTRDPHKIGEKEVANGNPSIIGIAAAKR